MPSNSSDMGVLVFQNDVGIVDNMENLLVTGVYCDYQNILLSCSTTLCVVRFELAVF